MLPKEIQFYTLSKTYTLELTLEDEDKEVINLIMRERERMTCLGFTPVKVILGTKAFESLIRYCSGITGGYVFPTKFIDMEIVVIADIGESYVKVAGDNQTEFIHRDIRDRMKSEPIEPLSIKKMMDSFNAKNVNKCNDEMYGINKEQDII